MWGIVSIGQPYDSLILWPGIAQYEKNVDKIQSYKAATSEKIIVLVDTTQDLDCYEYVFWLEQGKEYYPDKKVWFTENDIVGSISAESIPQIIFKGFPVYILNVSDTTVKLWHQKYRVPLIQEALDVDGKWKPIELIYKPPPTAPLRDYGYSTLKPGQMLVSSIYQYKGNLKTLLRVKIILDGKEYFSSPFNGSIDRSQITNNKPFRFY
jgi:hypothetical protein